MCYPIPQSLGVPPFRKVACHRHSRDLLWIIAGNASWSLDKEDEEEEEVEMELEIQVDVLLTEEDPPTAGLYVPFLGSTTCDHLADVNLLVDL